MADDKAPEGAEGAEEEPKKKGKGMLFAIIGAVLLLAGGGGFFAYTKFLKPAPEPVDELAQKKAQEEAIGVMLDLAPFVVNLSDPKGKRYLKVRITLELDSDEVMERAEKLKPKIRDMVIMMLTSLTFEEVMTPEGKIRVRDELFERFNLILRPDRVKNIYFTEFVVQ